MCRCLLLFVVVAFCRLLSLFRFWLLCVVCRVLSLYVLLLSLFGVARCCSLLVFRCGSLFDD